VGQLLFVCAGNTCRSPLAAALAGQELAARGLVARVESAGVSAQDDAPASPVAVAAAWEAGLDLSAHRARLLTRPAVQAADLILVMGESEQQFVRVLAPEAQDRVHVLRTYASRGGETAEVTDPFGGDRAAYRHTLAELRECVRRSVERWLEETPSRRN